MDLGLASSPGGGGNVNVTETLSVVVKEEDVKEEGEYGHMITFQHNEEKPVAEPLCKTERDFETDIAESNVTNTETPQTTVEVKVKKEEDEDELAYLLGASGHPPMKQQEAHGQSDELNLQLTGRLLHCLYQCIICRRTFTALRELEEHQQTHSVGANDKQNEKQNKKQNTSGKTSYECTHCGKTFTTARNIKRHMQNHALLEKPYACARCEQAFENSQSLNTHMATHTGDKPRKSIHYGGAFIHSSYLKVKLRTMADSANIVDLILAMPFESLPHEEKLRIKEQGRATPKIDLVQKIGQRNRSFQLSWYDKVSWLTASAVTKKMYCWPCLLMKSPHGCVVWSKVGFGDLSNFDRAYKRHEKSNEHVSASARLSCMGRLRVEHANSEGARVQVAKHNETVKQNRAFLNRLIDVTSLLGRQELSFWGHDESSESPNKGNYREFTETLAKYDPVLSTQFESSTVFSGTSHTIQNDLISALAATISDEIRDEIQDAPFFGWQVDETTDASCRARLSVIVRYVDAAGKIQERFIGFFGAPEGRDAQSVFDVLIENMQDYNFKEKLVAQTYDGAAVLPSALNGLQAKVKEMAPSAMFVHCYAHRLNLVLSQGAKCLPECRMFFASLSGIATFFSKSTKRMSFLESAGRSRLPGNACTQWNFTSRIVSTVANNYDVLLQTFDDIIADTTVDDDSLYCAKSFVRNLEDFEFVFMLYTFEHIFSEADAVFDAVQQRAMDVLYCKKRIESLLAFVKEKSSEGAFQAVYAKAADLTSDPRDEPARKRCRRRRTQPADPQGRYRTLYAVVLHIMAEQIPQRFANLESMLFLELANPGKFDDMTQAFPEEAFQSVLKNYGRHFNSGRLRSELKVLYSNRDLQGDRGKLCDYLAFLKDMELDSAMPQLYKLFSLVATIGVASAAVDGSSSCLERLKSHSRNTAGQGCGSSLALLAVERSLVKSLEKTPSWYDRVTEHFLEKEHGAE
ncbi:52 kDa repressor of the inhibitor of the protein kinase-like [Sardina pilchardus]|uniref:52 kDa repressor of the inhibitor of the protein kinase-like n=1 Tax=Sardina pilchardus TaxID=27697 RepID=UPI002E15BFF1